MLSKKPEYNLQDAGYGVTENDSETAVHGDKNTESVRDINDLIYPKAVQMEMNLSFGNLLNIDRENLDA